MEPSALGRSWKPRVKRLRTAQITAKQLQETELSFKCSKAHLESMSKEYDAWYQGSIEATADMF